MSAKDDLNATQLVMWQSPEEVATDLEIVHRVFRLDELFDAGVFDAEDLVTLKAILAKSPWAHDRWFVDFCRETRKDLGYSPERFWWWPETWADAQS